MYDMDDMTELAEHLTKKQRQKLQTETFIHMVDKLVKKEVKDQDIADKVNALKQLLITFVNGNFDGKKTFIKDFRQLKKDVKDKYGYVPKGYYSSMYMGLGVSLGSAIGISLMTINVAFFAIGIGCGVAIGAGLGTTKEKAAEEKDLWY